MKPFNIKEYNDNPSRKVITKDGRPVRILCTNARRSYPIIALIEDEDIKEDHLYAYLPNGMMDRKEGNYDLFFAPKKKVIWGNLYSTQLGTTFSGDFYKTNEAALKEKAKDFSKYITTFKVEWEE